MPFPQQAPQPFTRDVVARLADGQKGVFGLFRPGTWVYIGKGDIKAELKSILGGSNDCIGKQNPTHFVTVIIGNMDAAVAQLIKETQPTCTD